MTLERFFKGCPKYQRSLANQEALEYLKMEHEGRMLHRVTAAFWNHGNQLASRDSWKRMHINGVSLIENEAIADIESALDAWNMSDEHRAYAKSLFGRKISNPPATIELSADEVSHLKKLVRDEESFEGCIRMLWQMGITAPTVYPRHARPGSD